MDAVTVEKFAYNFGLPGLMLAIIFVLVRLWIQSNEKTEGAKVASHEKLELERIKVEDKKADAMVAAFASMGNKMDGHHTVTLQNHAELSRDIGEIHTILTERSTPIEGVPTGLYGVRPKPGPR